LRNLRRKYISPEDYTFLKRQPAAPDEQIERIRRAHRNDLEEVLPFLIVGLLVAVSHALSYPVAAWLFILFTVARYLHSISHVFGLQPWRSIFFGVGDLALVTTTLTLLFAV